MESEPQSVSVYPNVAVLGVERRAEAQAGGHGGLGCVSDRVGAAGEWIWHPAARSRL